MFTFERHGALIGGAVLAALAVLGTGRSVVHRGHVPSLSREWAVHIEELVAAGDFESARDELKAGVEIERLDIWLPRLFEVSRWLGDGETELETLERLALLNPTDAAVQARVAWLLLQRQQPDDRRRALHHARMSVEAERRPETHLTLARALAANGLGHEAAREEAIARAKGSS